MLRTLRQCGAEVLPSNSRVRRRQERAWRQWPGPSRPFASPAPGRGIGAPISPIPLPRCRSASTTSIFKRYLPHQPQSSASILPPYALRAGRLVCDSLWPDKQSTKSQEPLLQGTASPCSTWPLFLQASAGKNPARSLPGSQDTAVPAVGAEDAGQPPHNAAVKTVSLACTHPTPPVIHCAGRRSASVSVRHTLIPPAVPVREDRCTPHHRHQALTPLGRPGPGPGGSLSHTQAVGLCRRPGA